AAQEAFFVEMLAGDPSAAVRALKESYEALDRMGERSFLSTIAGLLAQALYELGEYDEAEVYSRASADAAAADDVLSPALRGSSLAKIRAREGDLGRAELLLREALRIVEPTDLLNDQGHAFRDLSTRQSLAGRRGEAPCPAQEGAKA